MAVDSLFRYPGSKRRFAKFVPLFIEENRLAGMEIAETHTGSASVSLSCLAAGLVSGARLIERDPLVFSVWFSILRRTDELIERIQATEPDMKAWMWARSYLEKGSFSEKLAVDFACAGLILNRCSFSGIMSAGPIGGLNQNSPYKVDCRFNKDTILRSIVEISKMRDKIEPVLGDAASAIKSMKRRNRFIYADPPYHKNGKKFYRCYYNDDDHLALRDVLSRSPVPWLLSYDNSDFIRAAYKDFEQVELRWFQSAKSPRVETELLISNVSLARIQQHTLRAGAQMSLQLEEDALAIESSP